MRQFTIDLEKNADITDQNLQIQLYTHNLGHAQAKLPNCALFKKKIS